MLYYYKFLAEEASSSGSSEEELTDEEDCSMEELTLKQQHPDRLHPEMWYDFYFENAILQFIFFFWFIHCRYKIILHISQVFCTIFD